jgi:pimeloyl-ACP methyl ester carboxylesterase
MKQSKVKILGSEIAYLDNGSGDLGTILFIHGNSFSSQTFSKQFESATLEGYRLIALDLYGHGDSEKHENILGYTLPSYSKLVLEFIRELKISDVILAGHSLGGHIALEALTSNLEKLVSGVFVWGTPPLSNPIKELSAFRPNPAGAYLYQPALTNEEAIEFVTQCFGEWNESLRKYVDVVVNTVLEARPSLGASVGQLNFSDEVEAIENASFPVGIIYGSDDNFMSAEHFSSLKMKNLWRNKCHSISGSHFCHFDRSEEFNRLLLSYVQDQDRLLLTNHGKVVTKNNISGIHHLL